MTTEIQSLVQDVYEIVRKGEGNLSAFNASSFDSDYRGHVLQMIEPDKRDRTHNPKALHASKIGKNCLRQMWYGQHLPEVKEAILPHTLIKFTFGDLVEEFALDLAIAAGHDVTRRQERVEIPLDHGFTLSGRIDAVIDGHVVDVKSCSPYSFKDWAGNEMTADNDAFGYRWQLHTYAKALDGVDKERGYLYLMDKQNGHIGLAHVNYDWAAFDLRMKAVTAALSKDDIVPERGFEVDGKDKLGNYKLPLSCSYCDFKLTCWKDRDVSGVVRSGKVLWLVNDPAKRGTVVLYPGEEKLG